jgi:hypothetical protein
LFSRTPASLLDFLELPYLLRAFAVFRNNLVKMNSFYFGVALLLALVQVPSTIGQLPQQQQPRTNGNNNNIAVPNIGNNQNINFPSSSGNNNFNNGNNPNGQNGQNGFFGNNPNNQNGQNGFVGNNPNGQNGFPINNNNNNNNFNNGNGFPRTNVPGQNGQVNLVECNNIYKEMERHNCFTDTRTIDVRSFLSNNSFYSSLVYQCLVCSKNPGLLITHHEYFKF